MHVVIATAEPRGAYHLAPLHAALRRSPARFTHLIPYDEPVQGARWDHTSDNLTVVTTADRLVVTGGSYSAWTLAVAWHAHHAGVPITFSELAFVPDDPAAGPLPDVTGVSALSGSGADALARYLSVPRRSIEITGTPLLDTIPARQPADRHALIVSTDDPTTVDPQFTLRRIADQLRDTGWTVTVSPHPREQPDHWHGHHIADRPAARAAATVSVAVGYLGSAAPMIAAHGVPFIAFDPTDARRNLPRGHQAVAAAWTRTLDEALDAVDSAHPVDPDAVRYAVGPLGGAAERVTAFWTRPVDADRVAGSRAPANGAQ